MKVVIVGGAGQRGESVTQLLSFEQSITDLVIADRRLGVAQNLADRLGGHVRAVALDLHDEAAIDATVGGSGLLINATGPYYETLVPCLHAALRTGVNYCDYADDTGATESATALDGAAKDAGICAIVGMGVSPGLSNLMANHAASTLDQVHSIELGWASEIGAFADSLEENLEKIRLHNRASAVMEQFFHNASGKVPVFRGGTRADTDGFTTPRRMRMPEGNTLTFYAFNSAEVVTLPRSISGIDSVEHFVGFLPEQINDLLESYCGRVARAELDEQHAAIGVFEEIARDPKKWLARPADMVLGVLFVTAKGEKDGHAVVYGCAPAWTYSAEKYGPGGLVDVDTGAVLALTALKLLDGTVRQHGVFMPEDCFEPLPFMEDLAHRWGVMPADGKLLTEYVDRLDG